MQPKFNPIGQFMLNNGSHDPPKAKKKSIYHIKQNKLREVLQAENKTVEICKKTSPAGN